MDPQTKRTITAYGATELRDLIRKWMDPLGVSTTYHQSLTPASVMIEITYADSDGAMVRQQWIHAKPEVVRDLIQPNHKIAQGEFFK